MMNISEIRIKLMEESSDRLRAFCSITIDQCFVIRDLKIIDGTAGPFVAMPSRKLTGHCQRCHHKNHLRATFCNHCGTKQSPSQQNISAQKLYADVAHPINSECREMIQSAVIAEFEAELHRAGEPGYRSRYDDGFDFDAGEDVEIEAEAASSPSPNPRPRADEISDQNQRPTGGSVQSEIDSSPDHASASEDARSVEIDRPETSVRRPASDKPRRQRSDAGSTDDENDEFGAGIF